MADEERVDPQEDASRLLPVPRGDHRPAVRPAAYGDALVRAVSEAPLAAAAVAVAAAAAAFSGAAAATRLLWPWLVGRAVPPGEQQAGGAFGPGVHISYTHIEMRWPLGR
jgi:hypothetical protein